MSSLVKCQLGLYDTTPGHPSITLITPHHPIAATMVDTHKGGHDLSGIGMGSQSATGGTHYRIMLPINTEIHVHK